MLRFLVPLLAAAAQAAQPPTDLAIVNARIFTGVAAAPWAEAVHIQGERIALVGSTADVRAKAGQSARVIDAGGRLVIPGINDAHTHPSTYPAHVALEGPPAMQEDPTWQVVLARVTAAVAKAPAGGWILGEIGAAVLENPAATRFALDAIAGDRPVVLGAWHGHGSIFSTAALRRLKVSETEPDPPGGVFTRMPDGKTLTGLAHEYAGYILHQRLSMLAGADEQVRAYQRFAAEAAGFGITSVQAMMTGYTAAEAVPLFARAKLPIRVRVIDFPMESPAVWRRPVSGGSPLVTASGVKFIVDGTPVERLMFVRAPYSDAPSTRGRLNFPEADIRTFLATALAAGVQPMFHSSGDAAIDTVLSALEAVGGETWKPLRPRLEHADMFEPAHVERAKRLGAVVVQNPSHFMVGAMMKQRLGERVARTTIVKTILASGVPFALGSDGPINPFLNIMFATINEGNPAEPLTVGEALAAYTRGAAYAEMMEGQKGTIAPGMLADLAMLSQDIFKVAPPDLPKTVSVLTLVGGKVVHEGR